MPALVVLLGLLLLDGLLGGLLLVAGLVLLLLDIGRQLDAGDIQQRLQTVGVGLHQQDVAFAQHLVGRRHALALVAANQRDDLHIGFILHRADQRVQRAPAYLQPSGTRTSVR